MPKSSIESRTPIAAAGRGRLRCGRVGDDRRLGDLELEQRRLDAASGRAGAATWAGKPDVEQVAGREVDRDRRARARRRCQARNWRSALVEHVQGERPDQAGVLGERDEVVGRRAGRARGAASAAAPRRERTRRPRASPWAGSRAQLVAARSRGAARRRASAAACRSRPSRLVERVGAALSGLGVVHGDVGALQERLGVVAVRPGRARSRSRPRRRAAGRRRNRLVERLADPLDRLERVRRGRRRRAAAAELVAAEARDGVRRAGRASQAPPSSTSSASPAGWPSESLTSLKRSRSISSTATRSPSRARGEIACSMRSWKSARFGETGERVVQRLVAVDLGLLRERLLGEPRLRDVLHRGDREVRAARGRAHDRDRALTHSCGRRCARAGARSARRRARRA